MVKTHMKFKNEAHVKVYLVECLMFHFKLMLFIVLIAWSVSFAQNVKM